MHNTQNTLGSHTPRRPTEARRVTPPYTQHTTHNIQSHAKKANTSLKGDTPYTKHTTHNGHTKKANKPEG